jgi:hypothetical protein|tara:strand:+ start:631 stop:1602 length:972 start_codon:yes stop_codon:yes gene_type:complete
MTDFGVTPQSFFTGGLIAKGIEWFNNEIAEFEEPLKSEIVEEDYNYAVASSLTYENLYNNNDLESTEAKLKEAMPTWSIDKELSDTRSLVLHDGENTILAFRGTDPFGYDTKADLEADFNILIGANRDNMDTNLLRPERFQHAEDKFNAVEQKYGKDNLMLTGHSLSGGLSDYLGRKHGVDAVVFNAGESPIGAVAGLMDTIPKQQTRFYTTGSDIISRSNILYANRADVRIVPMREENKNSIFGSHSLTNFLPPEDKLPLKPFVGRQGIPIEDRPVIATPTEQAIIKQEQDGGLQKIKENFCDNFENEYYICRKAPKLSIKR